MTDKVYDVAVAEPRRGGGGYGPDRRCQQPGATNIGVLRQQQHVLSIGLKSRQNTLPDGMVPEPLDSNTLRNSVMWSFSKDLAGINGSEVAAFFDKPIVHNNFKNACGTESVWSHDDRGQIKVVEVTRDGARGSARSIFKGGH